MHESTRTIFRSPKKLFMGALSSQLTRLLLLAYSWSRASSVTST